MQYNVLDQVVAASELDADNIWVSKSGVKFRVHKIRQALVRGALKQLNAPVVPKFYLEDKETWEENPNDPNYIQAVKEHNSDRGIMAIGIYCMFGSDPIYVPESIAKLDSDDWHADLVELKIEVPKTKKSLYYAWLQYCALEDDDELTDLAKEVMRVSGVVLESDAQEAEATFPDTPPGNSDQGIQAGA